MDWTVQLAARLTGGKLTGYLPGFACQLSVLATRLSAHCETERAVLLLSELVTNSVRHIGSCLPGQTVTGEEWLPRAGGDLDEAVRCLQLAGELSDK